MQAGLNAGLSVDEFWDLDEVETIMFINAYQHRIDDQREVLSSFTAALINSNRGKGSRKVKSTDLFDREKVERERKIQAQKASETPEQAAYKQVKAMEKAARLPLPKKLREHRPEGGPSNPKKPEPKKSE